MTSKAKNSVAGTKNKTTDSEALEKEKDLMYDYEEGLGHNHQECIRKRRMLWGPRADSPPPSPIPSKRKSNIEAQNSVAATENKCSNSEALDKEKEWMYDYEEGFGHNHQKCIERRRKLWGPRADYPTRTEVFFPLYPPEFEARVKKHREVALQKAMSIHELEIQKVLAKMDALEAQKLSPPTPPRVSQGVSPTDVLP